MQIIDLHPTFSILAERIAKLTGTDSQEKMSQVNYVNVHSGVPEGCRPEMHWAVEVYMPSTAQTKETKGKGTKFREPQQKLDSHGPGNHGVQTLVGHPGAAWFVAPADQAGGDFSWSGHKSICARRKMLRFPSVSMEISLGSKGASLLFLNLEVQNDSPQDTPQWCVGYFELKATETLQAEEKSVLFF